MINDKCPDCQAHSLHASGAPGDEWTCGICNRHWQAQEWGPLDIKWVLVK